MDAKKNMAIVVIDLQKGIVWMQTKPIDSKIVIENCVTLVDKFRSMNLPVFLVHVDFIWWDNLKPLCDTPAMIGDLPSWWSDFVDELNIQDSDIIITKRQWWAFYWTELDLQLRRRGVDTIILCWIATSIWVESTARNAYELWYNQIFPVDAMSSRTDEEHNSTINNIFPRIGQVKTTFEVLSVL
jgi:nicotinamidase-related amidase